MNLNQTSTYLSMNIQYVRKLVQKGVLKSTKVTVKGEVERYEITKADADAFLSTRTQTAVRKDGRNKFTLYANPEELSKILEACPWLNEELIHRSNPPKGTEAEAEAETEIEDILNS